MANLQKTYKNRTKKTGQTSLNNHRHITCVNTKGSAMDDSKSNTYHIMN